MDAEQLELDINSFQAVQTQHANGLKSILKNYTNLLQDYHRLKSDYEEARESREKYKKIVKEADRHSFVLVLVDGDGYLFKDQFVRNRGEGGVDAAQELHEQINAHLATLGGDAARSRIMVRIYANLKGLSQTAARHGLSGNESRSMGPFASSFTRAQELFDFIDAGEKKEGADFKLRENFRLFIESAQCKHIFFAGCHDTGYLSMLTPYCKSATDRVTLIRGTGFHHEFAALGFDVLNLPTVFRSSPLGDSNYTSYTTKDNSKPTIVPKTTRLDPVKPGSIKQPCPFFQKGQCTFGKSCRHSHEIVISNGNDATAAKTWRVNGLTSLTKAKTWRSIPSTPTPPEDDDSHSEKIPINAVGDRVDLPLPVISQRDLDEYHARINESRLCNNYVLARTCTKADCTYNHDEVAPNIVNVLRSVVRDKLKCSKRGDCRSILCYKGHGKNTFNSPNGLDEDEIEWVDADD